MNKDFNEYLIAIDFGGVIEDTWSNKKKWLYNHGFIVNTPMARQELRQLIGKNLHQTMLVEVYDEKEMLKSKTFNGAKESLQYLQSLGKIAILTTRSPQKRATVLEWLNLIGIAEFIDELVMIGDEALLPTNTKIPSKLDWCADHHVKFLIDDDMRHLTPLDNHPEIFRIHYQMGSNQTYFTASNLTLANDWFDIVEFIKQICLSVIT
ncbi:MAG: hypothetical protein F6K58_19265 [Symploca sp. SIO2E9]|nr:hypothetical protein [Symploca sp. SIO2E9]